MAGPHPLPSAARRRSVTLLAALPWPAVLFQFVAILPGYDKLFRQLNLKLDDMTTTLLNVSAWTRRNVGATIIIVFALMAVSMVTANTVHLMPMSRNRRVAVLLFVFGLPCLVFGLAWLGVLDTHRRVIEGMNK